MAVNQLSLFGSTAPSTSIAGLIVVLPDACRCGEAHAVIGSSAGPHHTSLRCAACDRHRGWMSAQTHAFITEIVAHFGRPDVPIVVRRPRP